ncbi:hypothetical protein ACIBP4_12380 [Micromonospora maritima]|uniref:Uncharacterized protein n=1 Tax=Micromonospora maritima TaxID=986711 RepID=A0ABW7ZJQ9_9ACTN
MVRAAVGEKPGHQTDEAEEDTGDAVGVAVVPLLGVSLLAFLVVDLVLGARRRTSPPPLTSLR